MKRDYIDFHFVEPHQIAIHDRLINWARYVQVKVPHWVAPIWKLGKSNTRQWHAPEPRIEVDILDGHAVEKAVYALPEKHRAAIRWHYVYKSGPVAACRKIGVNAEMLRRLVIEGRAMLVNRG
jgi:DNA-directed RNA polymerase specialized sigma24 family protein